MSTRGLASLIAIAALLGASHFGTSKHRPRVISRTRDEKVYRAHANRRRKLALASKRVNRRRGA